MKVLNPSELCLLVVDSDEATLEDLDEAVDALVEDCVKRVVVRFCEPQDLLKRAACVRRIKEVFSGYAVTFDFQDLPRRVFLHFAAFAKFAQRGYFERIRRREDAKAMAKNA